MLKSEVSRWFNHVGDGRQKNRRATIKSVGPIDRAIRATLESLEARVLFSWVGATSGDANDAAHDYNNTANWAGGTIDDSFAGVTLTGDTTLYFSANRTTGGAGLNFGYAGDHELALRSDSSTARTLTLAGNIGGNFGGSGNAQNVVIGDATNGLNLNLGGGSRTLSVSTGDALTIANSVSNGELVQSGGTLTMAGNNTYTGVTVVTDGGTMNVSGSMGNSLLLIANGTLSLQSAGAVSQSSVQLWSNGNFVQTVDNALSGSAALSVSGTATLSHANNHTGGISISAGGTLNLGAAGALSAGTLFRFGGTINATVDNAISGTASVQFSGTGTTNLTHANDYSGTTGIADGTVNVTAAGGLGTGTWSLTGGTLNLGAADARTSGVIWMFGGALNTTADGAIGGTASLNMVNAGSVVSLAGSNDFTGGTNLSAGTLRLAHGDALASSALSINGGKLELRADVDTTFATAGITVNNSGLIDVDRLSSGGSDKTLSLGAVALAYDDAVLNVAGDHGYTLGLGPLTLNFGSLKRIVATGASVAVASVSGDNQSLTLSGTTQGNSVGTVATGAGKLTVTAGKWALTGTNTNTGETTINSSATLQVGTGGTSGRLGTNDVTNDGTLIFDRSDDIVVRNVIRGSGDVVQDGSGDVELLGLNTYTGTTTVNAGTLTTPPDLVPGDWRGGSVGTDGGSVSESAGELTISSEGSLAHNGIIYAYIGERSDSFDTSYQLLGDNDQFVAKVTGQDDTGTMAKAGIMFRASGHESSEFVGLFATPGWGVVMLHRTTKGAYAEDQGYDDSYRVADGPVWLKMTRDGNTVTGWASTDGSNWAKVGDIDVDLGSSPIACVAVDSDNVASTSTATFEDVSLGAVTSHNVVPLIPYTIAAEAYSGTDGRLVWHPQTDADSFTVQQSTDGGATFQTIATVPGWADTFLPKGLTPSTTYKYRVFASGPNGDSPVSPPISITTMAVATPGYYQLYSGPAYSLGHGGIDVVTADIATSPTLAESWEQAMFRDSTVTGTHDGGAPYTIGDFTAAPAGNGYYGDSFGFLIVHDPYIIFNDTAGLLGAPYNQPDEAIPISWVKFSLRLDDLDHPSNILLQSDAGPGEYILAVDHATGQAPFKFKVTDVTWDGPHFTSSPTFDWSVAGTSATPSSGTVGPETYTSVTLTPSGSYDYTLGVTANAPPGSTASSSGPHATVDIHTIDLASLTVKDPLHSANTVTDEGTSSATPTLYVQENFDHTAKIDITSLIAPETSYAMSHVLWRIDEPHAFESQGDFTEAENTVTLTVADGNREWMVKAGVDENKNGNLDSVEVLREVEVQVWSIAPTGTATAAYEGTALSSYTLGAFTVTDNVDPGADFKAIIDWADGERSTVDAVEVSSVSFELRSDHTYDRSGPYVPIAEIFVQTSVFTAPSSAVGSYVEVKGNRDLSRIQNLASHDISSTATDSLTPDITFDLEGGSYSLSASGGLGYSLSESFDQPNERVSEGFERRETGASLQFDFSVSGSFATDPGSVGGAGFEVGASTLSAEGSATLSLVADAINVLNAHKTTQSGQYTLSHEKSYEGGPQSYDWDFEDGAELTVAENGTLHVNPLAVGADDGLVREDAAEWAWKIAHEGLAGTYTASGSGVVSRNWNETGDFEAETWDRTGALEQSRTLTDSGASGPLEFGQTVTLHESVEIAQGGEGTEYSIGDVATAGAHVTGRTVTNSSSSATGSGQIDVSVARDKTGDLETGEYDLSTDASELATFTTYHTNQSLSDTVTQAETGAYTDRNVGNESGAGSFSLSASFDGSVSRNGFSRNGSLTLTSAEYSPFATTVSEYGDLHHGAKTFAVTGTSSGGTFSNTQSNQGMSTTSTGSTNGAYGRSITVNGSGSYDASLSSHEVVSADTSMSNQSLTSTGDSTATHDSETSGSGAVSSGNYTISTFSYQDSGDSTVTTTNQSEHTTAHSFPSGFGGGHGSGNDIDASNDTSTSYESTATSDSTTTNQSLTVTDDSTTSTTGTSTASSTGVLGGYATTNTFHTTATDDWTSSNQSEYATGDNAGDYTGTTTSSGNALLGTYSTTSTYGDTTTASSLTTNQSLTVTADNHSTSTATSTGTGNEILGAYATTESHVDSSTDTVTTSNQSQHSSSTTTSTDIGSSGISGNTYLGNYSGSSNYETTVVGSSFDTNQSETVTSASTGSYTGDSTSGGNTYLGTYSQTETYENTSDSDATVTLNGSSIAELTTSDSDKTAEGTTTVSGNAHTGAYQTSATYFDTASGSSTRTNQSLSVVDEYDGTWGGRSTGDGNEKLGNYTITTTHHDTSTDGWTSTSGPQTSAADTTGTYDGINIASGNHVLGTYESSETYTNVVDGTNSFDSEVQHSDGNSTTTNTGLSTAGGNSKTGAYSSTLTYADSGNATSTQTAHSETVISSNDYEDSGTVISRGNTKLTDYSTTTTANDSVMGDSTTTNQSLSVTDHNQATHSSTTTITGHTAVGDYTLSSNYTASSSDDWTSINQSQESSGGTTGTYSGSSRGDGNSKLHNDTLTSTAVGTVTSSSDWTSGDQSIHSVSTATNVDTVTTTANSVDGEYSNVGIFDGTVTTDSTTTNQSSAVTDHNRSTSSVVDAFSGNSLMGIYGSSSSYTKTNTDTWNSTNQSMVSHGDSTGTYTGTSGGSGDEVFGDYDTTTTYGSTVTGNTTSTNASLDVTAHYDTSDIGTTTVIGDDLMGTYDVLSTGSTTGTSTETGHAGDRTFSSSDAYSVGYGSSEFVDTWFDTREVTTVRTSSDSLTRSDTFSTGTGTQTLITTGSDTAYEFDDYVIGYSERDNEGDTTQTTRETGTAAGGHTYVLTGTATSTYDNIEDRDSVNGGYTLTASSTDVSTFTRLATDGSGNLLAVTQSAGSTGTAYTSGNHFDGDYTVEAIGSGTGLTRESVSGPAGTYGTTQTDAYSSSLDETGDVQSGVFNSTEFLTTSSTLTQSGTDGDGTFSLSETTHDSPTVRRSGNAVLGEETSTQTGAATYSLRQTNSSGSDAYTLSGDGVNTYTVVDHDYVNSGDYDSTKTGSDTYDLVQDGTAGVKMYTLTLSGTDGYTTTVTGNTQDRTFAQSTTGGGTGTKSESGTVSGTAFSTGSVSTSTSFMQTQSGDGRDGEVNLSKTGTSRYDLLEDFNDTSDGGNGAIGFADASVVGLPVIVGRANVPAGVFAGVGDSRYEYCFAKGTQVLLANGTTRAIEQIEAGTLVFAVPDANPEAVPTPCRVVEVYHNRPARLLAVTVSTGQGDLAIDGDIYTTDEHPFYVREKGWTKAKSLQNGDKLRTSAGSWANVLHTRDTGRTEPVFNLCVEGSHTYFVLPFSSSECGTTSNASIDSSYGAAEGAILVHNESNDDFRWGAGIQLSLSADSDGRVGWRIDAGLGAAQRIGDNVDLHADLNFSYYGNRQGVPRGGGTGWDVTGSVTAIGGAGEGEPLPVHLLNYYTNSNVPNTLSDSMSMGRSYTYNSTLGQTTIQGNVGIRVGDVSVWYHNDADSFPTYTGFVINDWPDGRTDSAFTGGGGFDIAAGNGTISIYQETFTGLAPERGTQNDTHPWTSPFYDQESGYDLNRTDTGVSYTDSNGSSMGLNFIGPAVTQNLIHDANGYHRFRHDWQPGFEIYGSAGVFSDTKVGK